MPARDGVHRTGVAGLTVALALVLLAVLVVPAGAVTRAHTQDRTCNDLHLAVPGRATDLQAAASVGAGPEHYTITGTLCLPAGKPPSTVLFALHGITYDREYWDSRFEPENYSWSRAMNEAGYATFAIDRLGYGRSSRPPSSMVTLDAGAAVVTYLIGRLRAGRVGGTAFPHVVLVGHSYGAAVAARETAQFNDADALILSGWGSTVQPEPAARMASSMHPAAVDGKFAAAGYDPGYLTQRPGTRAQPYFFDLANVEPAMLAYDDEELRDTVPTGESVSFSFYNRYGGLPIGSVAELPVADATKDIAIPTFLLDGARDRLFCGPGGDYCRSSAMLQRVESVNFGLQACFRAAVVPDAGHNLNLQRNARSSYATMRSWLDRAIRPDGARLVPYVATCGSPADR